MSLLFQPSPLFQPPPPPCVKCGITTVIAPAFEGGPTGFRGSVPRVRASCNWTGVPSSSSPPRFVPHGRASKAEAEGGLGSVTKSRAP
jgi:hypothetical protein